MRAQGSSEYLLMFSAALMILLLALGFFTGFFSGDTSISQSRQYWESARPLAIRDYAQSADLLTVTVFNQEPEPRTVHRIQAGDAYSDFDFSLAAGNGRAFQISGLPSCSSEYDTFAYDIIIIYSSIDVSARPQTGVVPLVGKCS